MANPSRDKGIRFEKEVVEILKAYGYDAKRVPLVGEDGTKKGRADVVIALPNGDSVKIQTKHRDNLSMDLWNWLEGVDWLIVRRNYKEPLLVLPLRNVSDPMYLIGPSLQ